ncbi:MAG: tetratricopeptide repeat protein [bacterium]|nr:tetratricopeptide repeat protein [bacterium]
MSRIKPIILKLTMLVSVLFWPVLAHPAEESAAVKAGPRVMVIMEESIDGQPDTLGQTGASITAKLREAGLQVIEGGEARRRLGNFSYASVSAGNLPTGLTTADADILLIGKVDGSLAEDQGLGGFIAYLSDLEMKAIQIDTGSVLISVTAAGNGLGAAKMKAARISNEKAGQKAVKDIIAKLAQVQAAEKVFEIRALDLPNVVELNKLKEMLDKVSGVKQTRNLHAAGGMTKLEVVAPGLSTEFLGQKIEEAKALPLTVSQVSPSVIEVRYNPMKSVKARLLLFPFEIKGEAGALKWLEQAVPEIIRTDLANSKYFQTGKIILEAGAKRPENLKSRLRELKKQYDVSLVGSGQIEKMEGQYRVSLELFDTETGETVTVNQAIGVLSDVTSLAHQLAVKVDQDLYARIFPNKSLEDYRPLYAPPAPDKKEERPWLEITKLRVDNIYPARFAHYATFPLGDVIIKNLGAQPISDLVLEFFVPKYMNLPFQKRGIVIGAGESATVPITAVLDNEKILEVEENTPIQAQVKLVRVTGGGKEETNLVIPLVVYNRNAINWADSESVAGFVTPKDDAIQRFVRDVLQAQVPENPDLEKTLVAAARIFDGLSTLSLQYLTDPSNPYQGADLDYVQYPRETLTRKAGDCDDLSSLYAACLEAVGIETAFVTTPGHIFMMFNTGTPRELAEEISLDPKRYVIYRDTIWIPVETTKVGSDFSEAWRTGAGLYYQWKEENKVEIVSTKSAWAKYPPVPIMGKVEAPLPNGEALSKRVNQDLAQLIRNESEDLAKVEAAVAAELKKKPDDIKLLNQLATLEAKGGRFPEANVYYQKALKISPNSAFLHNNLANSFLMMGQLDQAQAEYQKARDLEPANGKILVNVGLLYYLKGDDAQAQEKFAEAVKQNGEKVFSGTRIQDNDTLTRGAEQDKGSVLRSDLRRLLMMAGKAVNKRRSDEKPEFTVPLGVRGKDASEKVEIKRLLHWM